MNGFTKNVQIFLILLISLSFSQENNNLSQVVSPTTTILNSRYQILQLLLSNELIEVENMIDQINTEIDTVQYAIFSPYEDICLDLILGNFHYLKNIEQLDSITNRYYQKISIPSDALKHNMRNILIKYQDTILVKSFKLTDEHSKFSQLFTKWFIDDSEELGNQEILNKNSDEFLEEYPSGKQSDFVRKNIRYVVRESHFGCGLSFFSGAATFTGNISDKFTSTVLVGHTFDFFYKNVGLVFYNQFAFGKRTDKIIYDYNDWPISARVTHLMPSIHTGYLFNLKPVFIFPYAGIGVHAVSISDTAIANGEVPFHSGPVTGVTLDWKLLKSKKNNDENSTMVLRTEFSVITLLHSRYDNDFSGLQFLFKVGIGGLGWMMKQD